MSKHAPPNLKKYGIEHTAPVRPTARVARGSTGQWEVTRPDGRTVVVGTEASQPSESRAAVLQAASMVIARHHDVIRKLAKR